MTDKIPEIKACPFTADDLKQYYGVLWSQADGVDIVRDFHIRKAIEMYARAPLTEYEVLEDSKLEIIKDGDLMMVKPSSTSKQPIIDDEHTDEDLQLALQYAEKMSKEMSSAALICAGYERERLYMQAKFYETLIAHANGNKLVTEKEFIKRFKDVSNYKTGVIKSIKIFFRKRVPEWP